jgi:hypothetical protein
MEIYKIQFLNRTYWFNSGNEEVIFQGSLTKPIPISRDEISIELKENGLKVRTIFNIVPFKYFMNTLAINLATLTLFDYASEVKLYDGRIVKADIALDKNDITLYVSPKYILNNATVPNRSYSANCSFNLGDKYCKVNIDNYKIEINEVNLVNPKELYSPSLINKKYLTGGYVITNQGERNFIIKHNSSTGVITLLNPFSLSFSSYTVYPSCDKTPEGCAYYNNKDRFGGFPFIPNTNISLGTF